MSGLSDRLQRTERVVQLRSKAVDAARQCLADAHRVVLACEEAQRAAVARWRDAMRSHGEARHATVDAMREHDAFVLGLRAAAERARLRTEEALGEESRRREDLTLARQELRKVERWREGLRAAMAAQEHRAERRVVDEFAARRTSAPPSRGESEGP